jgi:N-methylhydantoinase A/oxoprolinase/acetone carboxylase beta subunit
MTATPTPTGWQFWIDRGGTFTDVVGRRPDGIVVTHAGRGRLRPAARKMSFEAVKAHRCGA